MQTADDIDNRRIRELIEQFNAEECYATKLENALEELRKLVSVKPELADLIAALRKTRWKLPPPPPVNAIGILLDGAASGR